MDVWGVLFGLLKTRWRILSRKEHQLRNDVSKCPGLIHSICILHNWLINKRAFQPQVQMPLQHAPVPRAWVVRGPQDVEYGRALRDDVRDTFVRPRAMFTEDGMSVDEELGQDFHAGQYGSEEEGRSFQPRQAGSEEGGSSQAGQFPEEGGGDDIEV